MKGSVKWIMILIALMTLNGCSMCRSSFYRLCVYTNRPNMHFYNLRTWPKSSVTMPQVVMPRTVDRMCYSLYPDCREYHSTACINGKKRIVYGMACLQQDCTWRTVGPIHCLY